MSSDEITPGTAFKLEGGEHGLVAVKMDPSVTAGPYFVIDPINGGGYANPGEVAGIEASQRLLPDPDFSVDGDGDEVSE